MGLTQGKLDIHSSLSNKPDKMCCVIICIVCLWVLGLLAQGLGCIYMYVRRAPVVVGVIEPVTPAIARSIVLINEICADKWALGPMGVCVVYPVQCPLPQAPEADEWQEPWLADWE